MGKELICLDTSVLIEYFRKKIKTNTILFQLLDDYDFAVSVITKFEILTGSNDNQKEFWNKFFLNIKILPLTEKDINIASELYLHLLKTNKNIGLKDTLIAATSLANNLKLSTLNLKHFERVENLNLL